MNDALRRFEEDHGHCKHNPQHWTAALPASAVVDTWHCSWRRPSDQSWRHMLRTRCQYYSHVKILMRNPASRPTSDLGMQLCPLRLLPATAGKTNRRQQRCNSRGSLMETRQSTLHAADSAVQDPGRITHWQMQAVAHRASTRRVPRPLAPLSAEVSFA